MIWLDLPSEPAEQTVLPVQLAAALSERPKFVAKNRLDYLVELESESAVRAMSPDLGILRGLAFRGLIVTSRAEGTKGADFVSRCFAPYFGIDEDPVTGSTHCALGPYWAERIGRTELTGYQASDRGGWIHVRVLRDRVEIGGSAVVVARGTLSV